MKKINLSSTEVLKCESCNSYHPIDECEYITIKIIKGKDCPMPEIGFNNQKIETPKNIMDSQPAVSIEQSTAETSMTSNPTVTEIQKALQSPNVVKLETPEERKIRLEGKKMNPLVERQLKSLGNVLVQDGATKTL